MKKIMNYFNFPICKGFVWSGFVFILCVATFSSTASNDKVMEAFNLRLNGKADQAKELLLRTIEQDPGNAIARFELARTLNYMNLRGSKEADEELKLALELDPENVTYAYYNAKNCFLKAYIAMQQGGNDTKNLVNKVCDEFIHVLTLKSEYPEALMYLVEIYGILPENMGGDKSKAEIYVNKLEKLDDFYGAKARLVIMPEGTNQIDYWNNYINKHGESCLALKELGNAYIFNNDIVKAKEVFSKAMNIDKSQNVRLLDLARFHMMKVMQDKEKADVELPKAKVYIDQYLESTPEPIAPLKAYAMGMKVKTEMFSGNNEEGQKLMEEAKKTDPYFSRAFGIPSLSFFEPPTQIDHHFTSFFSPF